MFAGRNVQRCSAVDGRYEEEGLLFKAETELFSDPFCIYFFTVHAKNLHSHLAYRLHVVTALSRPMEMAVSLCHGANLEANLHFLREEYTEK